MTNKAYIFDFDDNIITMPSTISLQKEVSKNKYLIKHLSTKEYAEFNLEESDYELYPNSFSDFTNRLRFLNQLKESISNFKETKCASYDDFKEAILSLSTICIITARGHDRKTIKDWLMILVDETFSDEDKEVLYENLEKDFTKDQITELEQNDRISSWEKEQLIKDLEELSGRQLLNLYLKNQFVYAVNWEQRLEQFPRHKSKNTAQRKLVSLKDFLDNKNLDDIISIGFSDDDKKNINKISDFLKKESSNYGIECMVYSTGNWEKKRIL